MALLKGKKEKFPRNVQPLSKKSILMSLGNEGTALTHPSSFLNMRKRQRSTNTAF